MMKPERLIQMLRVKHLGLAGLLLLAAVAGCVPEGLTDYDYKQFQPPSTLPEDKGNVLIGEQDVAGVTVALYIDKGAHTGYNRIGVMLRETASAALITEALVSLQPGFELDGASWDVPFENPAATLANDEGFFEGAAMFLPPAPDAGSFSLTVDFDAAGTGTGQAVFDLDVEESLWMQRVEDAGGRYYVSWVNPARPEVGKNPFEVDLHRETEGGYVPVDDVSLDLYPYMDMGGGEGHSTPFEAPVHLDAGRYRGSVDFIMAGGWEMTVYVNRTEGDRDTVRFVDYTVYSGGAQ